MSTLPIFADWRDVPDTPPPARVPMAQLQWLYDLRAVRWGLPHRVMADTEEGREAMRRLLAERGDPALRELVALTGGLPPDPRPMRRRGRRA